MLLNKTDQLIEDLNAYKLLRESSKESQDYISRNSTLKEIVIYVRNMSEIVELFKNQGFQIEIDSIINYPIELFRTLYKKWELDKKSIIQKNDFFRQVEWNSIESKILSIFQIEWEKYIEENKPNINNEILTVFKQIPEFSSVVNNLKEKLELLDEYKEKLPTDITTFQLIISISSDMNNIVKQLESENIPDSVINFLMKAVEGIDLSEITTEILDWLKANDLIHLCQVKFRK